MLFEIISALRLVLANATNEPDMLVIDVPLHVFGGGTLDSAARDGARNAFLIASRGMHCPGQKIYEMFTARRASGFPGVSLYEMVLSDS